MKNFHKAQVALGLVVVSVLGFANVAGASTVTEMATTAAGDLTPIILGVGGALVAVAVTRFGVRWVLRSIGRGGAA